MIEILLVLIIITLIVILLINNYSFSLFDVDKIEHHNSKTGIAHVDNVDNPRKHRSNNSRSIKVQARTNEAVHITAPRQNKLTVVSSSRTSLPPKITKVIKVLEKTNVANITERTLNVVKDGLRSLDEPKYRSNKVVQEIKKNKGKFDNFDRTARDFINNTKNGNTSTNKRRKNEALFKKSLSAVLTAVAGARGPAIMDILEIGHDVTRDTVIPAVRTWHKNRKNRRSERTNERSG